MSIFIRTIPNVMAHYGCTEGDAQRYIDLREEGYTMEQAALMAGLTNPPQDKPLRSRVTARDLNLAAQFAGPDPFEVDRRKS